MSNYDEFQTKKRPVNHNLNVKSIILKQIIVLQLSVSSAQPKIPVVQSSSEGGW